MAGGIIARFKGTCARCGGPFGPGDSIRRFYKYSWAHNPKCPEERTAGEPETPSERQERAA